MMPVQTSSDHFGVGYHLSEQGQGVHQDPSWPAMFQNQYFPRPWHQMPQSTTIPVTVSHTGAPSPIQSCQRWVNIFYKLCRQPTPNLSQLCWGHHPIHPES
jgi:hypothetical protein